MEGEGQEELSAEIAQKSTPNCRHEMYHKYRKHHISAYNKMFSESKKTEIVKQQWRIFLDECDKDNCSDKQLRDRVDASIRDLHLRGPTMLKGHQNIKDVFQRLCQAPTNASKNQKKRNNCIPDKPPIRARRTPRPSRPPLAQVQDSSRTGNIPVITLDPTVQDEIKGLDYFNSFAEELQILGTEPLLDKDTEDTLKENISVEPVEVDVKTTERIEVNEDISQSDSSSGFSSMGSQISVYNDCSCDSDCTCAGGHPLLRIKDLKSLQEKSETSSQS